MNTKTAAAILQALLIPALGMAFLLTSFTHTAPVGDWVGTDTALAQKPHNVPAWTEDMAADFPACEKFREGVLVSHVVIVDQHGDAHRVTVDAAMERATNDKAVDDMWVVGICQPTAAA